MTIVTTHANEPQKKIKKIVRKKKLQPQEVNSPKRKKLIRKKPKQETKVKKLVRSTPKPTSVQNNTHSVENNTHSVNEPSVPYKDNEGYDSGSDEDIELVFTVNWIHRNFTYLLDEVTGEVFSKKDHSLIGRRYINDDELSVIDYDYADNE